MNKFISLECKPSFKVLICNNNIIITNTYKALFCVSGTVQTALTTRVHLILPMVLLVGQATPNISKIPSGGNLETFPGLSFWTRDGFVFFLGNHQVVK